MTNHRYIVLGDAHVSPKEQLLWECEVIPDLNALGAEQILCLGDLTGGAWTGTLQGTQAVADLFSQFSAPWVSIIGNHDLQSPEYPDDQAAVAGMLAALGRDSPQFALDLEDLSVLGLSNTRWRDNTVNNNEIVIGEEQLTWCREALTERADRPVLVLCHAPVLGGGLMIMPELHARVGNAVVNQNNDAGQLAQVLWEHPNILFWFSGHTHLGQHYRDALTQRLGVIHAHVGTASRRTMRDGYRHSRVLEIVPGGIRLRTYDHGMRAFDDALEFHDPHTLQQRLGVRRRMSGKRFIPTDPATMTQGYGRSFRPDGVARFVFLSDVHAVVPLPEVTRRVLAWVGREVQAVAPDLIILGGDIPHHSRADEVEAVLDSLSIHNVPMAYIPGNYEYQRFDGVGSPAGKLLQTEMLAQPAEAVFLLAATTGRQLSEAVKALLPLLKTECPNLVFAHFPPEMAGEEWLQRLTIGPRVDWICGHRHEHRERETGSLRVRICAGLDAIKARGSRPGFFMVDWSTEGGARVHHREVSQKYLSPRPERLRNLQPGLAFLGTPLEVLETAITHQVPAAQFYHSQIHGEPTHEELTLASRYRETVPEGLLSLHLPNFPHPQEGPDLADFELWLAWAEAMRLDDLTVHLPQVTADLLYTPEGSLVETDWSARCLDAYTGLARRAVRMGASLSLENHYNKANPLQPDQEKLSSQPGHLIALVRHLRTTLESEGVSATNASRVGIIFDTGHAFTDPLVSKQHGLADWLERIHPYLQLLHVHQVVTLPSGSSKNHRPISSIHGPKINYAGFLSALADVVDRPIPLLVEVRSREEALLSWKTLNDFLASSQDATGAIKSG